MERVSFRDGVRNTTVILVAVYFFIMIVQHIYSPWSVLGEEMLISLLDNSMTVEALQNPVLKFLLLNGLFYEIYDALMVIMFPMGYASSMNTSLLTGDQTLMFLYTAIIIGIVIFFAIQFLLVAIHEWYENMYYEETLFNRIDLFCTDSIIGYIAALISYWLTIGWFKISTLRPDPGNKAYLQTKLLMINEECIRSIDMGNYYWVLPDGRDLNYEEFLLMGRYMRWQKKHTLHKIL